MNAQMETGSKSRGNSICGRRWLGAHFGFLEDDPVRLASAALPCHIQAGDYAAAIAEGHKAEKLRPHDQLVHTNLSLFYMKSGDKKTAEHHGLQSRIASWKENMAPPSAADAPEPELQMAKPKPPPVKFPEMPWKKKGTPGKDGAK